MTHFPIRRNRSSKVIIWSFSERNSRSAIELSERDFRAMIYYDFLKGLSAVDIHKSLATVFGKNGPSISTIYKWFKEFKCGKKTLQDGDRPGRPLTAVTQENIDAVRKLIRDQPRITCVDIEEALGTGTAAINTILYKHLRVHKRCGRWVPHRLSDDRKKIKRYNSQNYSCDVT